ncbi:hypothetical protein BDW42DRAFT_168028 [Aspergillus taichungensis]|uniref:Uncharacterized protein n=1 Tax=Aspergillus taichungensis TaxID=482145 RepID=A0A2J5HWR1_9EURO|nr:hypothetical protein BDW42DRAFT_168028 [Aspergillus taichungensis]
MSPHLSCSAGTVGLDTSIMETRTRFPQNERWMVFHSVLLVVGCDMIGIRVAMVVLDVQLVIKGKPLIIKAPIDHRRSGITNCYRFADLRPPLD